MSYQVLEQCGEFPGMCRDANINITCIFMTLTGAYRYGADIQRDYLGNSTPLGGIWGF